MIPPFGAGAGRGRLKAIGTIDVWFAHGRAACAGHARVAFAVVCEKTFFDPGVVRNGGARARRRVAVDRRRCRVSG